MRTPMPVIEETEVRRGPWTLEEDTLLTHYISRHGEGRWNMLAKCAGLKRSGKSCRLRWLNYLKPDIKRGNLTSQEQLLILELHAKWGNKWSKIAQHLPGRTDNEIKNYWRTRVQKQARQLNIESSGKEFMDAVRCYWMPRLLQEMDQTSISPSLTNPNSQNTDYLLDSVSMSPTPTIPPFITSSCPTKTTTKDNESSSSVTNPTQPKIPVAPDFIGDQNVYNYLIQSDSYYDVSSYDMEGFNLPWSCHAADGSWASDDVADTTWNMDDIWQFREGGVTN